MTTHPSRTRTDYGYLLLATLLRMTGPRWLRVLFCKFVGSIGYLILPALRRTIAANLEAVTGNRARAVGLSRRIFVNYCLYLADYLSFPSLSPGALARLVSPGVGKDHLISAHEEGNGVILITPHLGHWEAAGILLSRNRYPINVVSLPDEDLRTEAYRNRMRRRHGIRSVRTDPRSASLGSMVEMLNVLKSGELIAMLTDRPTAGRVETVPFFGRPTPLPAGAFILSWIANAPVVPSCCVLGRGSTYTVLTHAPIRPDRRLDRAESIRRCVLEMARCYETFIRAHPDQWYNFYPYWRSQDEKAS